MVRVGTPSAVARPTWHDRNPIIRIQAYLATLAPHTATERWSYTVPSGKKAFVEFIHAKVRRATAASTASSPYVKILITPSGGSETSIMQALIRGNAVDDKDDTTVGHSIILLAGDKIAAQTADASTGGTVDYQALAKITEFDA